MKIDIRCKRCPKLIGDTWCDYWKKEVWREDEMCEKGYDFRIERGISIASKYYDISEDFEDPKVKNIMNQLEELEKIWKEKFGNKEDCNGI